MDLSILKWDDMWSWNRAIEVSSKKSVHISQAMREADAENRFGLTSFFHHFSNFLEAWHWPNKILQLAQGLGSYSSLRRTQKALGGRLGGAVGIGGDFFFLPVLVWRGRKGKFGGWTFFHLEIIEVLGLGSKGVQKNPKWKCFRYRRDEKTPTPKIWKFRRAFALTWKTPKELKWKRQKAMMLMQMKLFLKPKAHHLGCGWYPAPPPTAQHFFWGLFRAWGCLKKKTKKNKNCCDLVPFFPVFCLCDLDLVTLYCTFPAASKLVWWNMWFN